MLAPGWRPLAFAAPQPGSYRLPASGRAVDGRVLDAEGHPTTLAHLFDGKVVLLAFFYRLCDDVNGCPLTEAVLRQVQRRLAADPDSAEAVRLLSLSFDHARDTPETLQPLQQGVSAIDAPDWAYLTTAGVGDLAPILDGYRQSVTVEYGPDGAPSGALAHILRVFLIDAAGNIRNIYSASFLHADTVVNDIRTLLMEGAKSASQAVSATPTGGVDLVEHATRPRPGLPAAEPGALLPERVSLGRRLFFDRRLSLNNTISCAMCHVPEQGFTSHELATSVGFEGRTVRRNAPTLFNVGYLERLFHDGREFSLEDQVWGPLLAANEMANPSPGYLIRKIEALVGYREAFQQSFGDEGVSMRSIGLALAAYQRTLVAGDSPFDRWRYAGDRDALDADAIRGYRLFVGKAGCAGCHRVGPDFALFTDHAMHNTGIGYRRSMTPQPDRVRVQIAPGVEIEVERAAYAAAAEPVPGDLGLYEITQNPDDRWKYRTPSLRNVALTAPYMHDGSLRTLDQVVEFYDRGGDRNPLLDPAITPLKLTAAERDDLVAFLHSLTSPEAELLVRDARSVQIGDVGMR